MTTPVKPAKLRVVAACKTARDSSPLSAWWSEPGVYDERHLSDVIEMLEAAVLPNEPRWRRAARGDAASAIYLAVRVVVAEEERLLRFRELILIALWRCAAEGDVTAALVLNWLGVRRLTATQRGTNKRIDRNRD